MIATNNQSFLDIENVFQIDTNSNILNIIKQYFKLLKYTYKLNKDFRSFFNHIEFYIELGDFNDVQKIDDILIKLEMLSERIDELLEQKIVNFLLTYPIKYFLEKAQTSSMSVQTILGIKQAHIMGNNESN